MRVSFVKVLTLGGARPNMTVDSAGSKRRLHDNSWGSL
jgi:hypothetical protein